MESYLKIVKEIMDQGKRKTSRTGVDTISLSGAKFEHDMSDGFPLLTTKKMFTKGIFAELEFFIKGITDKNWLRNKGVHIWDDWCGPKILYNNYKFDSKIDLAYEFINIYAPFKEEVPEDKVQRRFKTMVEEVDSYFKNEGGNISTNLGERDLEKLVSEWDKDGKRIKAGLVEMFAIYASRDLGPMYGFQWRHCGAKYR